MPLTGGASDKLGNRYEGLWTVDCMVQILEESADSIRLEPPGSEGEGAEFILRKAASTEYHQVKRQTTAEGRWSISALKSRGVLDFFLKNLPDPSRTCVFISTHDAFQIAELSERSRDAVTLEEFERDFMAKGDYRGHFNVLRNSWNNCSEEECYQYLKRVRIENISERLLKSNLESKVASLVNGDPSNVIEVLAQFALEKIHHDLIAKDIWSRLEERGHRRRHWASDALVMGHVEAQNRRYFSGLRNQLIGGDFITRPEPEEIIAKLCEDGGKNGVMVVGEAGIGKSAVLFKAIEMVEQRGIPFICFRIDNLDPVQTPLKIGQQLDLPDSPAHVLANIAKGRPCALIIDQLDAVSLASGRNPSFFDCIKEIIDQALVHSNIKLIVACRKWDLENDSRFKQLIGKEGALEEQAVLPLSFEVINQAVGDLGLDARRLTDTQRRVLAVPERLKLLAEIATEYGNDFPSFSVGKDLYDKYWVYKDRTLRTRLGHPASFNNVVNVLCDYMEANQTLSVPDVLLDDYKQDADAMASEHILIHEGSRYRFFHEGFFDYCFARRFFREGRDLMEFLLAGEQHLFRRGQVRQILTYQRSDDRNRYINNLRLLLTDNRVRFHIKSMVLEMLSFVDDPQKDEWEILSPMLNHEDKDIARHAWMALRPLRNGSKAWMTLLDSLGCLEAWLNSGNDEIIDWVLFLLSLWQESMPDRVAELLTPYIRLTSKWPRRIAYIINRADLEKGRKFFELFLKLLDEELLDDGTPPEKTIALGDELYLLPDKQPEWACEVIGLVIRRRAESYQIDPQHSIKYRYSIDARQIHGDNDIFKRCAKSAPFAFIEHVFPGLIDVLKLEKEWAYATEINDPARAISGVHIFDITEAIEEAFVAAASSQPSEFINWVRMLNKDLKDSLNICLVAGLTALGPQYADESATFISEYLEVIIDNYFLVNDKARKVKQLISVITPHCSLDKLNMLTEKILEYYPRWETGVDNLRYRGINQYLLLEGIEQSRRSVKVRERLGEWERKHGQKALEPRPEPRSGTVYSPVPDEAIPKMTDEQWLKAIEKYSGERRHHIRNGEMVGDYIQLSRQLGEEASKQPSRFAELFLILPDNTNPTYFSSILNGVSKAEIEPDLLFKMIRRCHELEGGPCGNSIADAIKRNAQLDLPDLILEILIWYAVDYPDASPNVWTTKPAENEKGREILIQAINTVRGQAIEAIGYIIEHHHDRVEFFKPELEKLVKDPSILVRCCTALALICLLRHNRDLAVGLFVELSDAEDELLCTRYAEDFIHYASYSHFDSLMPVIKRMLESDIEEVVSAGARRACVASLGIKDAQELAQRSLQGTEHQRIGAAQIYSANLDVADLRSTCENALQFLFNDDSEQVRKKASSCFYKIKKTNIVDYPKLIEEFIHSRSFESNHELLLRALENSASQLPDLTIDACNRFLDIAGASSGDIQRREAFTASLASKIIIRLYSQTPNDDTKQRCLDVIDRMTRIGSSRIVETLSEYEGNMRQVSA